MEVTNENFDSQLEPILASISACDFVCFDCEFTGLGRGVSSVTAYDTPQLAYSKLKSNVGNFLVTQFGLCTFRYEKSTKSYEYASFSCFVYPRLPKRLQGLREATADKATYSFQADSLQLLASHNFDFNKWIAHGVSYVKKSDCSSLHQTLSKKHKWRKENAVSGDQPKPNIADNLKPKIAQIVTKVDKYLNSDYTSEPHEIENLTGFERKLTIESLRYRYGSGVFCESQKDDRGAVKIMVHKCDTVEDNTAKHDQRLEEDMESLSSAAGFTKVIDHITSSGKPLIGHNMSLDLLHTLKAFCADLPTDWKEFKSLLRHIFPKLYDTKLLATEKILKALVGTNPSLEDLKARIQKHPFPQVAVKASKPEYGFTDSKGAFHDAGYDAYVTGMVFLAMGCYWGDYSCPTRDTFDLPWDLLAAHKNKLFLARLQDMNYLDLELQNDVIPDRSHVFLLRMEADTWANKDIVRMFSAYGFVKIFWINDKSAWVALDKKENAKQATESLCTVSKEVRCWSVTPATVYLAQQENFVLNRSLPEKRTAADSPQ